MWEASSLPLHTLNCARVNRLAKKKMSRGKPKKTTDTTLLEEWYRSPELCQLVKTFHRRHALPVLTPIEEAHRRQQEIMDLMQVKYAHTGMHVCRHMRPPPTHTHTHNVNCKTSRYSLIRRCHTLAYRANCTHQFFGNI